MSCFYLIHTLFGSERWYNYQLLVRDWSGESGGVPSDGEQETPHQQPEQHGGAKHRGAGHPGQHSSSEIRIFLSAIYYIRYGWGDHTQHLYYILYKLYSSK